MKKNFSLFFLIFLSANLFTDIELSFGLNSKSIWRGLDQNDGNPTVYSEIEYESTNGFLSNAWVESCCSNGSTNANIQIEFGSKQFNLKIFNGLEKMSNYYEISYEYFIKDILLTISVGDFKPYKDVTESNGKNAQLNLQFERLDLDFELFYFYFHPNDNNLPSDDGLVLGISKSLNF